MLVINNVNYLCQRDAKWANKMIGDSNVSIGRMGCLITCLSMASQFFGCYQSPDQIASNVKWFDTASLIWINMSFPSMSFRWREGSQIANGDAKFDLEVLKAYLAHGDNRPSDNNRVALINVANGSHWVLGLWYNDTEKDILAIDPWTGKTCWIYQTYGNITGGALMVRWNKDEHEGKEAWQVYKQPLAPDYF